jgi:hypothetical protein
MVAMMAVTGGVPVEVPVGVTVIVWLDAVTARVRVVVPVIGPGRTSLIGVVEMAVGPGFVRGAGAHVLGSRSTVAGDDASVRHERTYAQLCRYRALVGCGRAEE